MRSAATAPLPRRFYARPAPEVARALLGCVLVHDTPQGRLRGRIVEVEAYGGEDDPASHAAPGPTPRNRVMYGPPGHAYVYFSYGMHHCLNVVTGAAGAPSAILVRAVEPLEGVEEMRRRRRVQAPELIASGPGRLAQAFGIDLALNGHDLLRPPLWLEPRPAALPGRIASGPRIGIRVGRDRPWRFHLEGSGFVSPGRRARRSAGPRDARRGVGA